jgi:4-amino-4-deoxy-L-arabinose transferase-like glycosyltransferase
LSVPDSNGVPLPRGDGRLVLALVALFVAVQVGAAASLAGFHGDERFYTDAALEMGERGEWTVPRYGDGSPRFNKPLLAYWLIGGSFELFGVGALAARLPFLLAMGGAVFVTWRIGLAATGDRRVALAAAALYAATSATTATAQRSTPDALQALGVAITLWGLVELLGRTPPRWAAARVWLGVGLVIAAKIGLGLLVGVFAVLVVLASGGDTLGRAGRLRRLCHPSTLLPGLALALAGTVPMYLGASDALQQSFDDQVGARVPESVGFVLSNLARYALAPLRHFAPFSLLALWAWWVARRTSLGVPSAALGGVPTRRWQGLALAFTALLVVMFAFGNLHRARYLLPAYPLVAVLVAWALRAPSARLERLLRALGWIAVTLLVVFGAALVREPRVALAATALALVGALLLVRSRRASGLALPAAATLLLLVSAFFASALRPAFCRSPVPGMVAALGPGPHGVVVLDPRALHLAVVAANLRVESGGAVRVFTAEVTELGLRSSLPSELTAGGADPALVAPLTRAAEIAAELPRYTLVGTWAKQRIAKPKAILAWALRGGARPPVGDPDELGLWVAR